MIPALNYLMPGIALLLAACTSPIIHYHTLLSPTPEVAIQAPFAIEVLPVTLPAQLDMPQVVIRENSNDATILENERWLSPLNEELTTALTAHLVERLGTQEISGLSYPANRQVVSVKVKIRRFDSWPGNRVTLEADWSVKLKPENRQLICSSQISQQVKGDVSQLFPAWQYSLIRLSEQIAAAAMTLSTQTASCPPQGQDAGAKIGYLAIVPYRKT